MKKSFLIFTLCIYNALIGQQESALARALANITINNKRIFPSGFADLPFEQQDRILNFEIGQFLAKLQGYYPYLTIPFVGQHTLKILKFPKILCGVLIHLLAYSSGTIQTFNTTSGQKILNLGTFSPYHIALNHDGSRFAGSGDQVLIIDASTGQVIYGVETFEHVYSLAWSHDNSKLATATIDNVEIWDGRGNRLITLLPPEQTDRMDIAWTPDDSRIVALGFTPTPIYTNGIFIYAWDINTRARVRVQRLAVSRSGRIREISWSPDCSKIAVTYGDNDYKPVHGVDVFDGTSGERIAEMNVKAIDVTWSPDSSQLAIVSSDTIDIYDIMPGHQGSLVAVLNASPDTIDRGT